MPWKGKVQPLFHWEPTAWEYFVSSKLVTCYNESSPILPVKFFKNTIVKFVRINARAYLFHVLLKLLIVSWEDTCFKLTEVSWPVVSAEAEEVNGRSPKAN